MCIREAREHLGKFLKRFVLKYKSTVVINESLTCQSNDGKKYFYYGIFPVLVVAVVLVTGFDIYFYKQYHSTSSSKDKKFLYLFPMPCIAPSVFVVNCVLSVATAIKLFCWNKIKKWILDNNDTEPRLNQETPENMQDTPEARKKKQSNAVKIS